MKTRRYKLKNRKTRRGGMNYVKGIFGSSTTNPGSSTTNPESTASGTQAPPQKVPKNIEALKGIVDELEKLTTKLKLEIGKSTCD
jgi:hypothetical protein